jgi:hypothetical protein
MDFGYCLQFANCSPLAARHIIKMIQAGRLIRQSSEKGIEINLKAAQMIRKVCTDIQQKVINFDWVPISEAEDKLRELGKDPASILPSVTQKLMRSVDPHHEGRVDLYCRRDELNKRAFQPSGRKKS